MTMAAYMVHLSGAHAEESAAKLVELFPGQRHHKLSKRAYLVRTDEDAEFLVDEIGLGSNDRLTGAVFKLNSAVGGYDDSAIWDWLLERNAP